MCLQLQWQHYIQVHRIWQDDWSGRSIDQAQNHQIIWACLIVLILRTALLVVWTIEDWYSFGKAWKLNFCICLQGHLYNSDVWVNLWQPRQSNDATVDNNHQEPIKLSCGRSDIFWTCSVYMLITVVDWSSSAANCADARKGDFWREDYGRDIFLPKFLTLSSMSIYYVL